MKNNIQKLIMLIVALGVVLTLGACSTEVDVTDDQFDKIVDSIDGKLEFKEEVEDVVKKYENQVRPEKQMWDKIHVMANSIVEADRKWGKEKITKEKVNALILEVMASDYENKSTLLGILQRWKEGDFSRAHHDHNAVWHLLGGTVGHAKGVNYNALPAWSNHKQRE